MIELFISQASHVKIGLHQEFITPTDRVGSHQKLLPTEDLVVLDYHQQCPTPAQKRGFLFSQQSYL